MTERNSIESGWLSYTCRAGWIDWGHALPGTAREILDDVARGYNEIPIPPDLDIRLNGSSAFVVNFRMTMGGTLPGVKEPIRLPTGGKYWVVKKGLTRTTQRAVALSIFMAESISFETWQRDKWWWATNSGMSAEDMVSNLVGFYGALHDTSREDLGRLLGEVSKEESLRIWDEHLAEGGIGTIKNTTFNPIYFPSQECGPGAGKMPEEITRLKPSPEGFFWTRQRYQGSEFWRSIPGSKSSVFNFSSDGSLEIDWRFR